jgi:sugar phosphate permease
MVSTDAEKTASAQLATQSTDEISPVSSTHVDDNYELYKSARDVEIDPAEAARVLRKVDLRIMPILFITYMLQYLDKNTINFASVYGLQAGTGLKGNDYSWLGKSTLLNYSCSNT